MRWFKRKSSPPEDAIKEALKNPDGWVYEIDQVYKNKEEVPPHAIKGAWKVNSKGIIIGDFIPNPNYSRLNESDKT
ncbi:MAG: hypothetical protein AAGC65_21255 [Mucilaginibacter sp.]|uniref:hypothetical protein n=1 Tax=Mucilaginibacter sp. TaxID=1882438 RepID=UPI0031AB91A2